MAAGIMDRMDRSAPPPGGELRPFRFPAFVKRTIAGGPTVYASRVAGVPLVSLELSARAGAHHDPVERAGLATFTASAALVRALIICRSY